MAPIKFDDNIKDKLEKRTLQPSNDAWDTLSNRLNTNDKKNSKSLFFYIGIAASIVGVLFVTTQFFNTSEDNTITPQIVNTEIDNENEVLNTSRDSESITTASEANQIQKQEDAEVLNNQLSSTIKNEPNIANVSEEKNAIIKTKKAIINDFKPKESIAIVDAKTNNEVQAVAINKLTLEEVKVMDVVNQIKALDMDGTAVTNQEIEALLKQAEKDILKQRIYNETTRTVDADALLQDVEMDLDQSFRTKVFEALKSRYKTVKTAVAERNN